MVCIKAEFLALVCVIIGAVSARISIQGSEYKNVIQDEYIVAINTNKMKTNIGSYRNQKETIANTIKDELKQKIPHFQNTNVTSLIFPNYVALKVKIAPQYVTLLQDHPLVSFIEVNHPLRLYNNTLNVTGSTSVGDRTCLRQDTGRTLWGLSRISSKTQVNRLSEYSYVESDGRDVDVYVLDTGVRIEHEDFGGRATYGFTADDILIREGSSDLNGHGTHIAGIAGGTTYGVAKQANIISVKILDQYGNGYSGDMMEGLGWVYDDIAQKQAAKGRRAKSVINMSLGGERDRPLCFIELIMLDIAMDLGVLFVAAAGNDNDDACHYSPGRMSGLVTVGASDYDDKKSVFSNNGPCVDIFAPGSDILSAWKDSNDASSTKSGTSMATPFVTGVIARYLSKVCEMPPPASVKAWLMNLATHDALEIINNTPNKVLYMPCFWDGSSMEVGSVIIQENNFRFDIILFTLVLGFGVLILFAIGAITLSYMTYQSTKLNRTVSDRLMSENNSKGKKYQVFKAGKQQRKPNRTVPENSVPIPMPHNDGSPECSHQADNMGYHSDDCDKVTDIQANGCIPEETSNGIAVITTDCVFSSL